jgi:hypothetical protein
MAKKKTSLYGQYIAEREGQEIIEKDYGFASYSINWTNHDCYIYIHDFYIVPKYRGTTKTIELVDDLLSVIYENKCSYAIATIDPNTATATQAMKFHLSNKMKISHIANGMIYMIHEFIYETME